MKADANATNEKIDALMVDLEAGTLQYYVDVDQFRADTTITEATLGQCMVDQSSLRAQYGVQAAHAEAQAHRVKVKFEVLEATLYDHYRKHLIDAGEKITEKMLETVVRIDPRWIRAKNRVIDGEAIAATNKSLVASLSDRNDMLVRLGVRLPL